MLSKHSDALHSALAYLYKPKCEQTKFRTGVKFEGHRLKTEGFPVHQRATAQIPTSHHPVSHSSVTQFPRGFKLSVKVWLRLLPWVRGFLPYEYPSPSAERDARRDNVLTRTRGGQNTWTKTMTEMLARLKCTVASGPDCQRHQRASREPHQNEGEKMNRGETAVGFGKGEEFAWELDLTDESSAQMGQSIGETRATFMKNVTQARGSHGEAW